MNTVSEHPSAITDALFALLCDFADNKLPEGSPGYAEASRFSQNDPAARAIIRQYQETKTVESAGKWDAAALQTIAILGLREKVQQVGFQPLGIRDYLVILCHEAGQKMARLLPQGDTLQEWIALARRISMPDDHLSLAVRACYVPVPVKDGPALRRQFASGPGRPPVAPASEQEFAIWLEEQERHYPPELQESLQQALKAL